MDIKISDGNDGLKALDALVNSIKDATPKKDVPLVFGKTAIVMSKVFQSAKPSSTVSGFSGWGQALFGTVNYWGGFEDLPLALHNAGYAVIVVRVGPLSSNMERACEIWAQLTDPGYYHTSKPSKERYANQFTVVSTRLGNRLHE
jgi:hypothetical protein